MLIETGHNDFTASRDHQELDNRAAGAPLICGEHDHDKEPWGGIASAFGAVLAMYSAAIAAFPEWAK